MIAGMQDRAYSGPGAIWSVMPLDIQVSPPIANDPGVEKHFLGGRTVAVNLLAAESPCLIVAGWSHPLEGRASRRTVTAARAMHDADGSPGEMRLQRLSDISQDTDAVASWPISTTQFILMVHKVSSDTYDLLTLDGGTQLGAANLSTVAVPPGLVLANATSVRIAFAPVASLTYIVSTAGSHLRFSTLPGFGSPAVHDVTVAPAGGRLSGLTALTASSLRFAGNGLSVALTAEQTLPGLGGVSQGVILRLLPNGTTDPAYGEDGIWVAPLDPTHRTFRCAGETTNGVAGHEGSRIVAYGVAPDGGQSPGVGDPAGGLDGSFGIGGIAEADLGGSIRTCVVASDADWIYVVAQRLDLPGPTHLLGSRFAVTGGARDTGFGSAGTASITVADPGVEPSALLLQPHRRGRTPAMMRPARLLVAGHRVVPDIDCDHLPVLVALDRTTGQPVVEEGFGGVAFQTHVGFPALVQDDGSALVTVRPNPQPFTLPPPPTDPLQIRRINSDGTLGELINLTVGFDAGISRLTRLANGSLLVSGGSSTNGGWIARLTTAGVLDTTFGTNGIATPKPANSHSAIVLGQRTDGTLIVQVAGGTVELCQLTVDGQLMATYGASGGSGFVRVDGFTHVPLPGSGALGGTWPTCFLDADDQVIVVISNEHNPTPGPFGPGAPVQVALRRIRADGTYDKKFGIGVPSANPPRGDRVTALIRPGSATSTSPDYAYLNIAGVAWLGNRLYVVSTGFAGGGMIGGYLAIPKPIYPLLVVTMWTDGGKADRTTFPGGFQEGGIDPFQYWYAAGVQKEAAKSLLVFGGGGTTYTQTITVGGVTHTNTLVRQPGPAIFRIKDPDGIDTTFGDQGAAVIRVPELGASVLAGRLDATKSLATLAIADLLEYQRGPSRTTYGGTVRFS